MDRDDDDLIWKALALVTHAAQHHGPVIIELDAQDFAKMQAIHDDMVAQNSRWEMLETINDPGDRIPKLHVTRRY
jgi:hypothetical protein